MAASAWPLVDMILEAALKIGAKNPKRLVTFHIKAPTQYNSTMLCSKKI